MSAYCPQCETDLDPATGICPACRWDPYLAATLQPSVAEPQEELSLTERYRGTRYDVSVQEAAARQSSVSRGRAFVLLSLTLGAGLYMLVMTLMGPIF
jgi:hypothetical protein